MSNLPKEPVFPASSFPMKSVFPPDESYVRHRMEPRFVQLTPVYYQTAQPRVLVNPAFVSCVEQEPYGCMIHFQGSGVKVKESYDEVLTAFGVVFGVNDG